MSSKSRRSSTSSSRACRQTRRSVEDVRNLLIDRPGGGHVRLGEVADVRTVQTAAVIQRDAVSRRVDIVAGVDGRSVSEVAADLEQQLAGQDFPLEYHAEVLRNSTADEIGVGRAIGFAIAAAIAAFLLFQAAFRSWRLAVITLLALPLSLAGGLVAALFTEQQLSLGALLGLLAVFGLAARMGTMMISTLQAAPDVHRQPAAARDQFAPVLTSTVAIGLLALPFVVLGAGPDWRSCIRWPSSCSAVCSPPPWSPCSCCPASIGMHAGPHPVKRPLSEPEPRRGHRRAAMSRPRRRRPAGGPADRAGWSRRRLRPVGLQRGRAAPTSSYHPAELSSPDPQGVREVTLTEEARGGSGCRRAG